MPNDPPSFSVITPSYQQAQFIRTNIESVLNQNYPAVEHIVIDNASTDGTLDILREYHGLIWVSEPDLGQSDAFNKGVAKSSNEWIVWINSDDYLLPGALNALAAHLNENKDMKACYSNVIHVDESGTQVAKRFPNYSPWKLLHWWWSSVQLWQPGTVFNRCVMEEVGPLNINLHYAMDFELMLNVQDRFAFRYFDADLVAFRLHDQQKGHANEVPFIDERIQVTLSYWKNKNRLGFFAYRAILYFARGSLVFVEGLRQIERGNHQLGRELVRTGLLRNPMAVLRPEHLGFWLRKLIGRERYYRYR